MAKYLFIIIFFLVTACQQQQPPFSYDFEQESDLDAVTWKCRTLLSLSDEHVTSGKKSLKLQLYPSPYPGLTIENFNPDWSGYRFLDFDVYNPEKAPLRLELRIDDKQNPPYGDRYNNSLVIKPRANHISIPLDSLHTTKTGRKLKLSSIREFVIFMSEPAYATSRRPTRFAARRAGRPAEKHTIYLDSIKVD